jgi:hypothetical protein
MNPPAEGIRHLEERMTPLNAAIYIGRTVKTLAVMRTKGTSPKFYKRGNRVFYFKSDLDDWLTQNGPMTSTAQAKLKNNAG